MLCAGGGIERVPAECGSAHRVSVTGRWRGAIDRHSVGGGAGRSASDADILGGLVLGTRPEQPLVGTVVVDHP